MVAVAIAVVMLQPGLKQRVDNAIVFAAKTHAGHVFTVGHAYKLMDDGFYVFPGIGETWVVTLTDAQALRFLIRAASSFVVTPLPWEMASRSELAFLPEHLLWYLLVLLVPAGVVAGWRRDPLFTSILLGYVIPTAAALAITNGNVGTLLRLRGLVSPYLLWLSTLGLLALTEAVIRQRASRQWSLGARLATDELER